MSPAAAAYRRDLKKLTEAVMQYLHQLDDVMRGSSTPERGKKIARLSNALEMINDGVRYRSLGIDFRKDKKSERYQAHSNLLSSTLRDEK